MRRALRGIVVLALGLTAMLSLSHERTPVYDGTAPFVCNATTVLACESSGACRRGTAQDVNLSTFVKVDAAQRVISAMDGSGRRAPIAHMTRIAGHTVMQGADSGADGGRGWSVVVGRETGQLSATIVTDGVGFVVFGTCTPFNAVARK